MSAAVAVQKATDVPSRAEAAEAMEGVEQSGAPEDLYTKLKTLQRQLEFLEIQVRPRPLPPATNLLAPSRQGGPPLGLALTEQQDGMRAITAPAARAASKVAPATCRGGLQAGRPFQLVNC